MSQKAKVKEGYLKKEGGKLKTWRKRWCILQPSNGTLFYHTKQGGNLKGKIPLKYCGNINTVSHKGRKFCFEIETPDRHWFLCADTGREMQEWIDELKKVRDYFKGVDDEAVPAARGGGAPVKQIQSSPSQQPQRASVTPAQPASNSSIAKPAPSSPAASVDRSKVTEADFEKIVIIGRGSFGKVYLVRRKGEQKVFAMKVLNKADVEERNEIAHARAENSILRKLNCPFLVKMHYAFQSADQLYFVMDYVNGGELFFHLQKEGRFAEDRVRFYVAEIVIGLEYLHSASIIYRDLKPENLLLSSDGHIIMTDFGISKEGLASGDDRTGTFCGTPEYLAPEVLKQEKYTKAVDWWSLGTLMYEMLSGLPPFYSEEVQNMYYNIINTQLVMPKGTNEVTQSLLAGFLEKNPADRLSDPDKIKAHPFFKGIDWDRLSRKECAPPFKPDVKSEDDISQIAPEFIQDSIEEPAAPVSNTRAKPIHFEGFTFVGGK
eukprot:TRINITY_DN26150_c0_g1_i1.p1 TRINITY_DN26150_c0_g1~~TRINITY_DN26150_c0_g1_i1.p1  ORF type:complete len:490 (+),score=122.94 TRINITY_DN26150_c0_g1_i1:115-1584(+)